MKLVIGNKRLSSWSLRPWLVAKYFKIPFEEILIYLDQPNTTAEILKYSPTAKVPSLVVNNEVIWDSLAICEYLNDKFPEKQMWPKDITLRGIARSVSSEMHSGFATMRKVMSHDLQKQDKTFKSQEANSDIKRVKEIWSDCLKKSGGPFLFGEFSIADAMFAPVVNRFITYAVPVNEKDIENYMKLIRELPSHQEWINAGLKETIEAPFHP